VPLDELPDDGMIYIGPTFLHSDTQKLCGQIEDFRPNDTDRAWIARELGDVPVVYWLDIKSPCWDMQHALAYQDAAYWREYYRPGPAHDTGD
jgi:hypothetical protein